MAPNDIKHKIGRVPFQPIRIILSNGMHYDILEAGIAAVTLMKMYIGVDPDDSGLPTRSIYIDSRHVSQIEPLPIDDNGKGHTNGVDR